MMNNGKDNPYNPPSVSSTPIVEAAGTREAERPTGISFLIVLHILGALLLAGTTVLLISRMLSAYTALQLTADIVISAVLVAFLTVLAFAAGIGMWQGKSWGWRIATFSYVFGLTRNGSAIVSTMLMTDQLNAIGTDLSMIYVRYATRIAVQTLVLLYMFKPNVLNFFQLEKINKGLVIGIHAGISLAIVAVATFLANMLQ